jgi:DNA primase
MEPDVEPRYKNPTGADHRRLLIGWNVARLRGDLCIVEGPLDAVRFDQHGISTLAVGGKVLHSEQMAMLFKLKPSQAVTVCLDPEELMAPLDVANQLAVHFERIYVARLPMGVDPGDSSKKQALEAMASAEPFTGGRAERVRARLEGARTAADRRYR